MASCQEEAVANAAIVTERPFSHSVNGGQATSMPNSNGTAVLPGIRNVLRTEQDKHKHMKTILYLKTSQTTRKVK